jgi:hypothetical protein
MPEVEEKLPSGTGGTALKAAAAAAATGAATYAVRRALSHDDNGSKNGDGIGDVVEKVKKSDVVGKVKKKSGGSQSLLSAAAATGWDAASDALIPLAEDAAESAGKYVATHGPEILRERIVPKFIEAFNDAK